MNIVVIPGTNYDNAPAGFDAAVKYVTNLYDNLFSANVTVYINVDYGIVSTGNPNVPPLGASTFNEYDFSYSDVRQALINMGAPGSNTLPTTSPLSNDAHLWTTTAQQKALGLIPADAVPGAGYGYPGVDGNVVIASNQTWSFSPTATPAANQFYIVGALEHEFSEVLGRISFDGTNFLNLPGYTVMDLFRYSSPGVRQLSASSSPAYFSTDNGNSVDYYWNTHANGFDLNGELGDWWSSGPNNVDPTGPDAFLDISNPGQINGLSSVDLTLMQAIGWLETPVTPPVTPVTNPPPPAGTTADMIMSNPSDGTYEIYNVGGNAILAASQLGQVATSWKFAALGTFQAGDSSDMLLRNSSTGAFEANYISGNNITNTALVGTVGLDWNFAGTGDFDGASSLSELMLRNASAGSFELYHVAGGGVLSGSSVAPVGNNFQVKGFGNFSGSPETQMIMQDSTKDASAGQLELYTYQSSTASLAGVNVGKVGSNLSIVGCADLLGNGMTQMVMQQNNGNFWLYSYNAASNSLSGTLVGAIGSNFHVVGFGPLGSAGRDEMLMRDAAGNFEVYQYNASLNAFAGNPMGAVGAPWVVDGIAANTTSGAAGGSGNQLGSTAQLVQAMAGFGGNSDAAASLSQAPLGAETSQMTFLTTPHA